MLPDVLTEIGERHLELTQQHGPHEARKKLTEYASEHDLSPVGTGSSRYIYQLPAPDGCEHEHIVKFPIRTEIRDGSTANQTENIIWSALSEKYGHGPGDYQSVKGRFTPVVDADPDGRWLIMRKCEDRQEEAAEEKIVAMIEAFHYLPVGSEFFDTDDIMWYPRTHTPGEYRLVDYGSYVPQSFLETEFAQDMIDTIPPECIAKSV